MSALNKKSIDYCIKFSRSFFVADANEADAELAALNARIEKLEEVARVAGFIELNRHNYLFNGRLNVDKASLYYMDLLKEKLESLKETT